MKSEESESEEETGSEEESEEEKGTGAKAKEQAKTEAKGKTERKTEAKKGVCSYTLNILVWKVLFCEKSIFTIL